MVTILELNKIHQGNCLELMKNIPTGSVDMILCDLPYGTTKCKWDAIIPFGQLWEQYNRIIKDNGAIVLTASQPFTTKLIDSNIDKFCYTWVWDKKFAANFVQAKRQPLKTHEDIVIFSKNGKMPQYFPQMILRDEAIKLGGNNHKKDKAIPISETEHSKEFGKKGKTYTHKHPDTQITFNVRENRGLHPTQKPIKLFEYLLLTYSNEGEVVLDNCIGSGTTAIAAINTNRNWIGIEMEEEYVEIARNRIEVHKHNKELNTDMK